MGEAAVAQPAWVLLAYLIAGVCFILALRGLSGPESSRRGNRLGMIGMFIAVGTTVFGLIVAILAMIFSTTLKYRLVKTMSHLENESMTLSTLIITGQR